MSRVPKTTNTKYAQVAVKDPVLYVALYSTGDVTSEVDDYHWVFIVGPSHEEADSKGTLYSMEPRQRINKWRWSQCIDEWCWSYNQSIVPLQGRSALLARLMVAEVADMNMLQTTMLRWGGEILMREQVEWMSIRWVKRVLKSLEEDEGCLGKKMKSSESVEAEVCILWSKHILFNGDIWFIPLNLSYKLNRCIEWKS